MQRQKRPFYIIGHNPNTIEEAKEYLEKGANALEPDIIHVNGNFYVSHQHRVSYESVPTVESYLADLKELLLTKKYNLALIVWDIKDTDFDPNEFVSIVKENFSGPVADNVAMLLTHENDTQFLTLYKGGYTEIGIAVDESNTAPAALQEIFTAAGLRNCGYADGITTILNKPGVYKNVNEALACRNRQEPGSFSIVYTWVLSLEGSMKKYLDSSVDGIMVDAANVEKLNALLATSPYSDVFGLAKNGYNPFICDPIPSYHLKISTADTLLAGTDALILFTLTNEAGDKLQSLPFHSNIPGALERATTTDVTLQGMNLGTLKSITVEAISGGIAAAWLPSRIVVTSSLLQQPVEFIFNEGGKQQWVTKESGPVTILKK